MKSIRITALAVLALSTLNPQLSRLHAQGSEFTYNGLLNENGNPLNGLVELEATLWDAATNGNQIISVHPLRQMVEVRKGLFTVVLDFGKEAFPGPPRWLQIALRKDPDPAPFTTLWPRQKITTVPYAVRAEEISGKVPKGGLVGAYTNVVAFDNPGNFFAGQGIGLTDLNASQLTSGTVPTEALGNAWKISGNLGTTPGTHFLGTTDNQPLEIKVNGLRTLRLEPNVNGPNVIGGFNGNVVRAGYFGSTIGGGGSFNFSNAIYANYAAIAGGLANNIGTNAHFSAIGGGSYNNIASISRYSAISGGFGNLVAGNSDSASIAGGFANVIVTNSHYSAIGGGSNNNVAANAQYATIPGGDRNFVTNRAFAAGTRAKAMHTGAFVWADSQDADFPSTLTNQFAVRAGGGARFETAGAGMTLDGQPILSGQVSAAQVADGAITAAKLAGSSVGSAQIVDGAISAADVNAPTFSTTFWKTDGNTGTTPGMHFLGANGALELRVNNQRVMWFGYNQISPNVISGYKLNRERVGSWGVTIGGGGAPGAENINESRFGTISGGAGNLIITDNAVWCTIGGGFGNTIFQLSDGSAIGGGENNHINDSRHATIAGGLTNYIAADSRYATIAGGALNDIGTNSSSSTIGGGTNNNIAANSAGAAIAGGSLNDIGTNCASSAIGGGTNNNIAASSAGATIAGGSLNDIGTNCASSAIGGGYDNNIAANALAATIAGGSGNDISTNSPYCAIGGGIDNNIAAISGSATIAGGSINAIGTNSAYSAIGGGLDNNIRTNSHAATIAGGFYNIIGNNSDYSAIGGGTNNNIAANSGAATIAGGIVNNISINSPGATIGGGELNWIQPNGHHATIPGGSENVAFGAYSFAAGRRAHAQGQGTFVWADSQNADFGGGVPNSVSFRCAGGVRFDSGSGETVTWLPGFLNWSISSDRNLKDRVTELDSREVLEKVSRLSLTEWSYKGHTQRHIGPMAQDFHALFPLNDNDKMIDSGDLQGVALAAIQGLNQKLEEQLQARDSEIRELRQGLAELKETLKNLTTKAQE